MLGGHDRFPIICAMRIGVLVQEEFFASGVAALADVFTIAEGARRELDPSIPAIEVSFAGSRRRIASSTGLVASTSRTLRELDDLDLVVVPAIGKVLGAEVVAALETGEGRSVVRALAGIDLDRARVAAACTGVFPLAASGLLDGRTVTTTWFLVPVFRREFPRVAVDVDRMVVRDGPVMTAGAAFAHIDLGLAILRGISPELSARVAKLLVVDERPSQAAYVAVDYLEYEDALVRSFERHIRAHLDRPFDCGEAARAVGTSRRSLERRTQQVLGMSPLAIVQQLRIERALHLFRTTTLSNEAIAGKVGYASGDALRVLLRRGLTGDGRALRKHGEGTRQTSLR
jgi:transcriptional regulator GlxA family with amidase domain